MSPDLFAARDGTVSSELSHNAVLAISGDDAGAFLHGQFTNDVQRLAPGQGQWNGWCSAKGRLLATFLLVRRGSDYLMLLPAELVPAIVKRLRMYVLRSKVAIEDASARIAAIGVAGPDAAALVAGLAKDRALAVAAGKDRFVVFADRAEVPAIAATRVGPEAWEWTGIRAGVPTIGAQTQEEFVPQMANFEIVGGVSFKKGCYPGQEIVARTQYRGILKKRMVRAHVEGAAPRPGDALRTAAFGDQAAGTIVNVAPAPEGGHDLLAVAQLEGIESGDLRLADGRALAILELPYALADPA